MFRLYTLEKTLGMKKNSHPERNGYATKLFNAGEVLDRWITEEFGDAVELGRRYVDGLSRRFFLGGFNPNVSVQTYEGGTGNDRRLCVRIKFLHKGHLKPCVVSRFERYFGERAKSREVNPVSKREDGQACLEHEEF